MTPSSPVSKTIPTGAWIVAAVLAAAAFVALTILPDGPPGPFVLIQIFVPVLVGGYVVLIGYVYNDARRRGMRHVMWMWLSILIPNGLGIILYFILRDPLAVYCTKCGCSMRPGFAYCPSCGSAMSNSCGKCRRVLEAGWSHCAYCGEKLA